MDLILYLKLKQHLLLKSIPLQLWIHYNPKDQLLKDGYLENYRYVDIHYKQVSQFFSKFLFSLIALPITTPAPDNITGNFASDKYFAAFSIASAPPPCLSNLTNGGNSISITCVQKSRGTFICAGAEPHELFL